MQPSRHELHEQFNNPVKSSRRVVTHSVGLSMKSPASADKAGSAKTDVYWDGGRGLEMFLGFDFGRHLCAMSMEKKVVANE